MKTNISFVRVDQDNVDETGTNDNNGFIVEELVSGSALEL